MGWRCHPETWLNSCSSPAFFPAILVAVPAALAAVPVAVTVATVVIAASFHFISCTAVVVFKAIIAILWQEMTVEKVMH